MFARSPRFAAPGAARRGFTFIEIAVAVVLLVVGLLGLARATTFGLSEMSVNRDSARALQAARGIVEALESGDVPFECLFASLYADPATNELDPLDFFDGTVTETTVIPVLGRHFPVAGLAAAEGDPDGMAAEVVLPVLDGLDGPQLREDLANRDLDGDGTIDEDDHGHDYVLLPVTVRVEWIGPSGKRRVELHAMLIRR